ncbi:histone-lysine N-methyltransferase SETMAR [Elysia marginata]|uniref:Histone-lysine N-methyltransferase SETMAR n=1 Tax=Elysia marginata TaxID=1093978 RepID=A0AAV4IBN6_9GAST|nr:histone-lysine N-methyltransferase SETMAR [Elysia marginata]
MDIGDVLLLHNNAQRHTSIRTRETIALFGWTTRPHLSYSPGLASSDYHLFGPMKQGLRGKHYEDDEEVKKCSQDVAERATNTILRGWNTCL